MGTVITPDGALLGRCDGQPGFSTYLGAAADLIKNIHGVAPIAELDGDEVGYLVGQGRRNQAAAVIVRGTQC